MDYDNISDKKIELIYDLQDKISANRSQLVGNIFKYCIINFINMRNFRTKKVVKNNFDIMKEYYSITREENRLLNFIINNIGEMDDEAVKKVIEIIDELNEST